MKEESRLQEHTRAASCSVEAVEAVVSLSRTMTARLDWWATWPVFALSTGILFLALIGTGSMLR